MTAQTRGSGHDWDDARKAALFARIVGLELSIDEAARLHGLRVDVIQEWLRLFRRSALLAFDERLKKTLIDQGANADALAAAEFTGHIEDVSIADLVQTIEIAGKDAVITVTHDGQDHKMWCSAGAIIDAVSGRLSGDAAVYRILGFERGRMVADLRPEPRERTVYAATHRLLIDAMRRMDESTPLLSKLGDVDRFYRLGERSTSARVHVSQDELSILRLFDGPRCVGDILTQSQLGDFETLEALVRLVEHGYLAAAEGSSPQARESSHADGAPRSSRAPSSERVPSSERAAASERVPSSERAAASERAPSSKRAPSSHRAPSSTRAAGSDGDLDTKAESALPSSRAPSSERAPRYNVTARFDGSARSTRAARATQPRRESGKTRAAARPPHGPRATPNERVAGDVDDPPRSAPTSYMPFAVSRPPHPTPERATLTPRWVFAAMAAAILAPAAFWFGETMSNLQAARRARAHDEPSLAAAPVAVAIADTAPSFSVSTRVAPAAATIWLDRHPVASGRLEIVLPKDGHTHELRAAADGYIPTTLMFADVAPPGEIRLEPLPIPRPEGPGLLAPETGALARSVAAQAGAPNIRTSPTALGAAPSSAAEATLTPAAVATRPRGAPPRAQPRSSEIPPAKAPVPLALPDEPHVPSIADVPKIQVIE